MTRFATLSSQRSQRAEGIGGAALPSWLIPAVLCLLAGTVLFWALAPWPSTPDGWLHLQRVRALAEALQAGVLYPRWFPDFSFGYGYPVLNFYAPGFYYGPALLAAAGIEVVAAVRIGLAVWFALSGLGMYALLRRWVGLSPALVGTILYLVFPYRLYDLFVRGALPEFAAFLWLPLIVLCTLRSADSLKARGRLGLDGCLALGALCWAGLILTHNLTAMMAALMAVLLVPLLALFHDRRAPQTKGYGRRLMMVSWAVLLPLLLGLLVSAWYWAPALLEARWVGIGLGLETGGYANHFAHWGDLFTWALIYPYPSAADATVPLPAWLLLVAALGAFALAVRNKGDLTPPIAAGLAALLVSVWLTTAGSAFVWQAAEPLLGKLQFPWRWQAIAGPSLALLAAVTWQALVVPRGGQTDTAHGRLPLAAAAAVSLYLILYATLDLHTVPADGSAADITTEGMWAFDSENGQVGASWTAEFLPNAVSEQRWAIGRAPSDGSTAAAEPPVALTALPQRLGYLSARYQVQLDRDHSLILHRFFFEPWRVVVDGSPVTRRAHGSLGLLAVDLPAGSHLVTVSWGTTAAVWIGRGLTLVGWLTLLWAMVGTNARSQPSQWVWAVAWLAVGAILLLGASGLTERQVQPLPVAADFGSVRLEAASATPARAGTDAAVHLHWSVQGPVEPLAAFVHVVDSTGAVVAQNDGPLGGDFTPVERWSPGLVMERTQRIALPADLPAGSYRLLGGVYRPGQAESPLLPGGASEPRVQIGTLEVRP
jgi:hypothetical protein